MCGRSSVSWEMVEHGEKTCRRTVERKNGVHMRWLKKHKKLENDKLSEQSSEVYFTRSSKSVFILQFTQTTLYLNLDQSPIVCFWRRRRHFVCKKLSVILGAYMSAWQIYYTRINYGLNVEELQIWTSSILDMLRRILLRFAWIDVEGAALKLICESQC